MARMPPGKSRRKLSMRINTNLTAMNTYGQYTKNNNKIASAVEKLSSGYAINSAADNAAGLAISEKMRAQIRGLEKASTNSQDAISLIQTAEGALAESEEILQRMRELAVQSSSDTNEDGIDRAALQDEFSQLQAELDEIAQNTTFNKKNLLDGSLSTSKISVGSGTDLKGSSMSVSTGNANAGNYTFNVSVVTTQSAIEAKAADSLVVTGSTVNSNYFSSAAVTGGATPEISDEASSLLNGSYTISVGEVNTEEKTFKLVATNEKGLSYTSEAISMDADYSGANNTITVDFGDDAFSIDFDLTAAYAKDYTTATGTPMGEQSLSTFADAFEGTTFTVSGGVDAQDAVKEVQASLTGASSITLKAGDTSATFDNGVTVYFDELTAESLDTLAQDTDFSVTAGLAADHVVGSPTAFANAGLGSTSAIVAGNYDITATATHLMAAGAAASSTTIFTTAATAGTAQFTGAGAFQGTLAFDEENNEYVATIGGETFKLALDGDTDLATTPGAAGAYTLTFTAADGKTLETSFYAAGTTTSVGEQLQSMIDSNGGTRYFNGSRTATNDGFQIVADNGTTSYTAKSTADPAAAQTAGATTSYTFKDSDGNDAFTLNAVNGTTAVGANNLLSALSALEFSAVDSDYKFESTFGSTASNVEVTSSSNAGLTFQVGANEGDELTINIDKMNSEFLGVNGANVATQDGASAAISAVDKAINQVSSQRAYLGAIQNRLDHKMANLDTSAENLTAAESQIRDVDMAKEMTKFTNANILQQAATAMLAQANSLPQNVLSLIGG
jgi:flagellin